MSAALAEKVARELERLPDAPIGDGVGHEMAAFVRAHADLRRMANDDFNYATAADAALLQLAAALGVEVDS